MKYLLSIFLSLTYLLSSSIFFHAQAMDIIQDTSMETDCAMHTMDEKSTPADTGCFEKCIGTYDDISYQNIEEEGKDISTNLSLWCHYTQNNDFEIYNPALYATSIDPGDGWWTHYSLYYISITKKLE